MLGMYVMDKLSMWEYYFHLVEIPYKNGYQASLKIVGQEFWMRITNFWELRHSR